MLSSGLLRKVALVVFVRKFAKRSVVSLYRGPTIITARVIVLLGQSIFIFVLTRSPSAKCENLSHTISIAQERRDV